MPDKKVPIPQSKRGRPKLTAEQRKRRSTEKALGRKLSDAEWAALQGEVKITDEAKAMQEMMAKVAHAQAEYQPNILPPEGGQPSKNEPGENDPDYEARKIEEIRNRMERSRNTLMASLQPPSVQKKEVGDHEEIIISRAQEPTIEDTPTPRKPKFVQDDEQGFIEVP